MLTMKITTMRHKREDKKVGKNYDTLKGPNSIPAAYTVVVQ